MPNGRIYYNLRATFIKWQKNNNTIKEVKIMKEFFKLYGFCLLVVFGIILFAASTLGVIITSVVLCIVFRTGVWAWLLTICLFTIPFWYCLYCYIKY